MNIINLLNLIKDQVDYTTATAIIDDFFTEYREKYAKARYTKTTAKNTIEKYIAAAKYKDQDVAGIYATDATALLVDEKRVNAKTNAAERNDLAKIVTDTMKNRRPVDCRCLTESVVLYKLLEKQHFQQYFIRIGDYYYNPDFIEGLIQCVATDKKTYIRVEVCENGALVLSQNSGAVAFVLPYMWEKTEAAKNVNFGDFLKLIDDIKSDLLNDTLKTA
jgi:hypothetical protein